jgi:hypothetical protein
VACTPPQILFGKSSKLDFGACGMHVRKWKYVQKFVGKTDECVECGKVFTGLKMCEELRDCVRDY